MLEFITFIFIIIAEILLSLALLKSLVDPPNRIWPPPKRKSWQFYYIWVLTYTSIFGLIALGLFDWNFLFNLLLISILEFKK